MEDSLGSNDNGAQMPAVADLATTVLDRSDRALHRPRSLTREGDRSFVRVRIADKNVGLSKFDQQARPFGETTGYLDLKEVVLSEFVLGFNAIDSLSNPLARMSGEVCAFRVRSLCRSRKGF
jgi:hypothetical protein